jgi:hypothetical protein
MADANVSTPTTTWALVEVMGHKQYAGEYREVELAGSGFIQVRVPAYTTEESWRGPAARVVAFTKNFSPASIYAITPMSEEQVRAILPGLRCVPVDGQKIGLAPVLPAPAAPQLVDHDHLTGPDAADVYGEEI